MRARRRIRASAGAVAAASFVAVAALASAQAGTAAQATCAGWTLSRPPSPGSDDVLLGTAVTSPGQVWAVGEYVNAESGEQDLIARWTGSEWLQVPSPNPAPPAQLNELDGVAAVSAREAWAVGDSGLSTGEDTKTLIARWRDGAWTQVASPSPGSLVNYLGGVAAIGPASAWAVGNYSGNGKQRTLILRFAGHAWQRVRSASPGYLNVLDAVAATSARDAWAVGSTSFAGDGYGRTLIERWNGSAWQRVPSPNVVGGSRDNDLTGVAVVSAADAWAVGDTTPQDGPGGQSFILHWNGSAWKRVPSPNPDGFYTALNSVVALSAADVWAVGATGNATMTLHWNGRAWRQVPSPDSSGAWLYGVAASSPANVWAVGGDGSGTLALSRCS